MKNATHLFAPIILLLVVFTFTVKAQTNVSGFISANTTWTLAGSPYIVVGNALVSTGYTLTIEPGVVVKFDSANVLQIDGEMIAIGIPQNRITFTSNQSSPSAGDWGELHFSDTCVSAVFDTSGNYVSGCIMKFCDVLYGGGLGYGAIHIVSSSPYISNCRIENSLSDGIYCYGSVYPLDSSVINNCMGYGLSFQYISSHPCGYTIKGDTFENNQSGGINGIPLSSGCTTIISNNYFISNAGAGAITNDGGSNIEITENYFIGNSKGVINFENDVSNITIECNTFLNNQCTSYACIYAYLWSSMKIENNLFEGNNGYITSIPCSGSDTVLFANNIVRNNPGGCLFQPNETNNKQLLQIYSNDFSNNVASHVILFEGGGSTGNSGNNILYMKHNNFNDPASQYEIYNEIAYGAPNIYADSNYWGTTNTPHIDSVIYDYFDYGDYSVVYYQPILTAPVVVDTSCLGSFPTGIKNIDEPINSKAFPNPFSTSTEVMFGKELKDGEVVIYNVFGQCIRAMEHINGDRMRIERGNLCSGVYIYEVLEKLGRVGNGKLVVE